MNKNLEIRKLPMSEKMKLIQYLEEQESWKKLMSIIPQVLYPDNYCCDISTKNPPKYHTQHFHIIQNASTLSKRFCAEILLREWGTSGRVRPTLGHLKYLLEKAQLFHAADFITEQVLKQPRTARPTKGPAAPLVFDSEELNDSDVKKIEKLLDDINYPSSAIANIHKLNSINTNIDYTATDGSKTIPKIVISESPDTEESKAFINIPLVIQNDKTLSESDLIKFSTTELPNIPDFPALLKDSTSTNIPVMVENLSSDSLPDNLPKISDLLEPNVSTSSTESSSNLPNIGELLGEVSKSRSCTSPLPNLSLNTPLPHFSYSELETATDNFDETPLTQNGRFLGAGNFGRVYYAPNLLDRPTAVKKLLLENASYVDVDDRITKQFTAEVEIFSKYKHENLVALLGYSCDGLTYCLVYEYVPGGTLKDRLEKRELIWTERLYIARSTAKAINYLHTGYSTPLIHRDVKSANILLDVNNKPKLCDFGLIKHCTNPNMHTATTIIGTSAYMAPEAFNGDISVKLDTFSFGVVLLELLTSKPPMDAKRERRNLVSHVDGSCKEGQIAPVLDTSVGPWTANAVNFGQKLYEIAQDCLENETQLRPKMSDVFASLNELIEKGL